jgi:hypothetical protein
VHDLQEATEKICDLKGSLLALDALTTAILHHMPQQQRAAQGATFERHAEIARTVLLHAPISDHTIAGFDRDVGRLAALIVAV